ncbi:hypothetical protein ACPUER_36815, partial [Burkholderia sp. DN3021]|uniref:hypothetical protein n=1 Tax=Burkholderia sp. DN3021 TaxID=3410137 RepID=UPI003C79766D
LLDFGQYNDALHAELRHMRFAEVNKLQSRLTATLNGLLCRSSLDCVASPHIERRASVQLLFWDFSREAFVASARRIRQMKTIVPDFARPRRVVGESTLRIYKMCGAVAGIGSLELSSRLACFGQQVYRRYPLASTVGASDEEDFHLRR